MGLAALRAVFMGTPEFALPSLEALVHHGIDVAAVFTQPDRPKGRGQQTAESPVKLMARRLNLPVHQPERIRRPESVDVLRSLNADIMIVVGYGQIIPQVIIDLPRHGILNVHASLLPKYRGAAPIQWAIANGETETGVTIMRIDAGLDTGDMLLHSQMELSPEITAIEASPVLAQLGAEALTRATKLIDSNQAFYTPQNHAEATLAPILTREHGRIRWSRSAREIYDQIRGFSPWPGAWTKFRNQQLQILRAKPANDIGSGVFGSLHPVGRTLVAACGFGTALELEEVQLEGRKRVDAQAFRNGQRLSNDDILGEDIN